MNKKKSKVFESAQSKDTFQSGIKLLAITLPLLFISPIVVTIGFKAIKKSETYFVLVLGIILTLLTIILMVQGFRKILKSLFERQV